MHTRRGFLATAAGSLLASPFVTQRAYAEQSLPTQVARWEPVAKEDVKDVEFGKFPGDYKCGHEAYHPFYQRVFGQLGQCACGDGECRVTDWRSTRLGSPKGYDVIVLRYWCALPPGVWIPAKEQIPKELRLERAHVCAYGPIGGILIPCVIINESKA